MNCMTLSQKNASDYLAEFMKFDEVLLDSYGPAELIETWKNERGEGNQDMYLQALSLGQLNLSRQWNLSNRTQIVHELDSKEDGIGHWVNYISIAHKDLVKKRNLLNSK